MSSGDSVVRAACAAKVLSAPIRLRILTSLLSRPASVSDLAARLDADRYRLSYHLAVLRAHALARPVSIGRLLVYQVNAPRVRSALAALQDLPIKSPRPIPAIRRRRHGRTTADGTWWARTCYDHLGGLAGVQLLHEFLRQKWLLSRPAIDGGDSRPIYALTTRGAQAFVQRGVNVMRAQRSLRLFACACRDWSPERQHLGGALGAAVLDGLVASGVIRLEGNGRRATLLRPVARWLDGRAASGEIGARSRSR